MKKTELAKLNTRAARIAWGNLSKRTLAALVELAAEHSFSIARGDLLLLNNHWYVTHTGLLGLARRLHCSGMLVKPVPAFCDPSNNLWAFEATVYKSRTCRGFVGYGDANPSNVSLMVHGAEMRVAETRAVNRALRKAYGIGICSVEEIGSLPSPPLTTSPSNKLICSIRELCCWIAFVRTDESQFPSQVGAFKLNSPSA